MNDLVKKPETYIALPSDDRDPFEAYGNAVNPTMIEGDLLKYKKGAWVAGKDEISIPPGTKLVADMDGVLCGWVEWSAGKPVGAIMGRIADKYRPSPRKTLGKNDESEWEIDAKTGKPKDPFVYSNRLVLKVPGTAEDGQRYTYNTGTTGGVGAIGELCKSFGRQHKHHPGCFPVISLESGRYKHKDPTISWVDYPILRIVGWTDQAEMLDAIGAADESDSATAAAPTDGSPASAQLDDDIPF